jgi:DNA invertase Pin-like site-specific DNA recombinase
LQKQNNIINFANQLKVMETNNKQNKCILLVRVSSYVQNYEAQMDDLIKYAEKLGYTKENQIIIANKESGKLSEEEREGLTEMFQYLESDTQKQINAVFVWEVSRI